MLKLMTTFFLGYLALSGVFGQTVSDSTQNKSVLYEKLYLHIDREVYSPGDEIWFKSYLVSGINNQLIPGYKNIYVQLIAADGSVIDERLMLSIDGVASNDFHLPKTLENGEYTIRGYTKYLENFGEKSIFHQKIAVARSEDSPTFKKDTPESQKVDVSFLPEGGSFVLNAANCIAFKAIDETGKGVHVSGKITDETGVEVVSFESRYKGMGWFVMMPSEGKTYTAKIEGHPDFSYQFDTASPDGIALNYKPSGNNLLFTLNRNIKATGSRKVFLTGSYKGIELFRKEVEMTGFQQPVEIFKGSFPPGISKITVYDERNNVLAERLVFVRNSGEKTLEINPDKKEYVTREKVQVDLASILNPGDTIKNSVSVAVVNEDYFSKDGISQTNESYLLLDSELKGPVESPASCFIDEENISADEKLDLVMMVNGWRHYYWDDLTKYAGMKLPGWEDIGLEIKGKLTKLFGDKPVAGGTVEVGPFSRNFLIEKDTTDENGHFSIDRIYLKDSALIMINGKNKRGGRGVEVLYQPDPIFDSLPAPEKISSATRNIAIPEKFYRTSYYKELAERRFGLENGTILLNEVNVLGKKREDDGHFRLYGEPDMSFKIKQDDWIYDDILDYLQGRAAGVIVSGDDVRIRGASRNPLFLVDGLETDWEDIKYFPMGDIDKIEILKSGASTVMYGSKGADGVISVLTRTGEEAFKNEFTRYVRGRITPRVRGFKQSREFYSPKYPMNELSDINERKPDFRPTMYWNPNLNFKKGKANIEFFASDMLGRYQVVVEGISKKGKIILGTAEMEVVAPEE